MGQSRQDYIITFSSIITSAAVFLTITHSCGALHRLDPFVSCRGFKSLSWGGQSTVRDDDGEDLGLSSGRSKQARNVPGNAQYIYCVDNLVKIHKYLL